MESLLDTRKWREQYEKENNINYFSDISNMTLPNDGELPDYDELAKKLNNNFDKFIDKVDKAISDK